MEPIIAPHVTRLDVVLRHLWLHLVGGAALSTVLLVGLALSPLPGHSDLNWADAQAHFGEGFLWLTIASVGAFLVGALRLPALSWLGRRAGQRQWPTAGLLLASAALFLTPMLPVCLCGEGGWLIGRVCLVVSAPYLISYVAATYWLRRPLCQPQPVAA